MAKRTHVLYYIRTDAPQFCEIELEASVLTPALVREAEKGLGDGAWKRVRQREFLRPVNQAARRARRARRVRGLV